MQKIDTLGLDESGEIMSGDASYTSYGAGIIFGGKILFKNIAVLDIFLCPSYTDGNLNINNGEDDHFMHFDLATGLLTGISFRAGISIGIAF